MCDYCRGSLPRRPYTAYTNGEPLDGKYCSEDCANAAIEEEWAFRMRERGIDHKPGDVCWGHDFDAEVPR